MDFLDFDYSLGSITEQLATPVIMSGAQLAYDMFIDKYDISQALVSSKYMFISLIISKFFSTVFVKRIIGLMRNQYASSVSAKLTEPVLNYFIYSWYYETKFKKYQIAFKEKTEMEKMFIPILQVFSQVFIDKYIVSWITGRKSAQGCDLVLNTRDSLYTNVRRDYITFQQADDKKSVLNGGKLITYNIKNQPYGAIESLKYHFSITNYNAAAYTLSTVYNLLNYIEIFNNNKSVEKIDVNTLFMMNMITVKQDSFVIKNTQRGLNSTTLAQNATAEFMIEIPCFLTKNCVNFNSPGDVSINIKFNADITTPSIDNIQLSTSEIFVYYYELTPSQDSYLRGLSSIDNRYLQIDHATYYIDNVLANNTFKFKITEDAVTPFILFHVQTKTDNDSFNNQFQNFIPVVNQELLGKNNQSTMNNVQMTPFLNNYQQQKHFDGKYVFSVQGTPYYGSIYMLNFCLNPQLAMQGNYVGAQAIEDNQYELKITLANGQSSIAINLYIFNYQMSHIEKKQIVFLYQ